MTESVYSSAKTLARVLPSIIFKVTKMYIVENVFPQLSLKKFTSPPSEFSSAPQKYSLPSASHLLIESLFLYHEGLVGLSKYQLELICDANMFHFPKIASLSVNTNTDATCKQTLFQRSVSLQPHRHQNFVKKKDNEQVLAFRLITLR